ncbi:MAG: addiction module protein [Arcobacteraceae bacterium]
MSIDEIKNLGIKERIILMNDIWESLESDNSVIESPTWHQEILEERIKKINSGEAKFISLEELKANK